jgi:hypothetical protein
MGAGNSMQHIDFQLSTNWGLTKHASTCLNLSTFSLHGPQAKFLCAYLPKHFVSAWGESPLSIEDKAEDEAVAEPMQQAELGPPAEEPNQASAIWPSSWFFHGCAAFKLFGPMTPPHKC